MKIKEFKIENLTEGCVTDNPSPRFSFSLESEKKNVTIESAVFSLNGWTVKTKKQTAIYGGAPLLPFTGYDATLSVKDSTGETAEASAHFETGRLDTPWLGKWISDPSYSFTESRISPVPMTFRRRLKTEKAVKAAKLYITAMGVYEVFLNGEKVGKDYFAPGFTSYKTNLQYQTYDVTKALTEDSELVVVVGGGWAVGSFVFTRKNRISADRQALLAELRLEYADGTSRIIATDTSWDVTEDGNYRMSDLYDGETYDATVELDKIQWRKAGIEKLRVNPVLSATYGSLVREHEEFLSVATKKSKNGTIYDFGQNFAGVVRLKIKNARAGQKIVVRHAEILDRDGELMTKFLRSAKATATYICRDGAQEYAPRLTYMGFRYAEVQGIEAGDVEVSAAALYSDIGAGGSFECSEPLLNRLQSNITWSGKSNFVDIPTDCPQRDERMGWTGDIAVFAPTACYNFDMSRFLEKWLKDLRNEQTRHGGIPNTVPVQGYGFPATMPKKAIAFWGDACVFVPWAMYLAYGDLNVLGENYKTMKKYVKACKFWANIGIGKHRYIWSDLPSMQFGDWIAPDVKKMSEWQKRCKWTGTASLAATSGLLAKIAKLLGKEKDEKYYTKLNKKVSDAYVSLLTDGKGKLKNEFQTAYVLPLYFDMFPKEQRRAAAQNLAALIEKNDYCIGTGFPGTPYILFALADNGFADVAFRMLLNTKCPSWLYEVKVGATTVWERWDGLDEDGNCLVDESGTDNMISYNHYASGAVGDFLYRRIAGIEPTGGGYKTFRIKPLIGGGLTYAKGEVNTPYGRIVSGWKLENGELHLTVSVPVNTSCEVVLPDGTAQTVGSGEYQFTAAVS